MFWGIETKQVKIYFYFTLVYTVKNRKQTFARLEDDLYMYKYLSTQFREYPTEIQFSYSCPDMTTSELISQLVGKTAKD